MKIITCEQQSPEWYQARAGVPSSSNFDKIVTTKGEPSKQAEKYMFKLAGEKIIGMPEEGYQNAAMLRGVELEAEARLAYEIMTGKTVEQVGFCLSDIGAGCSPDGMVDDDGLIEIKCPQISTHVSYLLNNKLPTDYFQQVQGQMFITGRKYCDFVSYYPGLRTLIVRVERNEPFINRLEQELTIFCQKLEETINKIR